MRASAIDEPARARRVIALQSGIQASAVAVGAGAVEAEAALAAAGAVAEGGAALVAAGVGGEADAWKDVLVSYGKRSQGGHGNAPSTLAGRAGLPPMAMPVMAQSWPMTWVWAWASAAGAAMVVAASARMVARVNCILVASVAGGLLGLKAVGFCWFVLVDEDGVVLGWRRRLLIDRWPSSKRYPSLDVVSSILHV